MDKHLHLKLEPKSIQQLEHVPVWDKLERRCQLFPRGSLETSRLLEQHNNLSLWNT